MFRGVECSVWDRVPGSVEVGGLKPTSLPQGRKVRGWMFHLGQKRFQNRPWDSMFLPVD